MPPSTERTGAPRARATHLQPFLYRVLEGERPRAGGARYALRGVDEVVLGRSDEPVVARDGTTLRIGVPDRGMSTTHARVRLSPSGATLEDLGSTNGTRVDGRLVREASLGNGQSIEVGHTLFVFTESIEPASARPTDLDASALAHLDPGLRTLLPAYAARLERLARIAASDVGVLLLGETGTGKEVLARAVHAASRRPGPFVAVNCGAIPAQLVESHLFGHVKGAFSGALRDEPGFVRSAQGGTLLLDEIGDLPLASQAALLRVLQEGEVMPVGAARATRVDVRIVAATHQRLDAMIERGAFRRDLYARLAGFTHELLPLRDRIVDLGVILSALLSSDRVRAGASLRLRTDVARALVLHEWPLNVRELAQCLASASVLAEDGFVALEHLPEAIAAAAEPRDDDDEAAVPEADDALRKELLRRLTETRGNVSEVARGMGKARQQIQKWLRRLALDPASFR